ncbi:glucarate dehydratase [Alicyclobacillus sacchari]|uniref:glucarate dehydratase n=1 Tax=Alicyclobacillus sacchari TaxID=392010 RepID=A0A4R8LGC0_9BACL|nr:enolase C-terminal domain-like protein [Alicyclobacillus sacchari]TDY42186.1 glucarate dehydratase [Alicyclobacillus sacchari]GMA58918.1 mandelate racemase [Alicyclobacillus sacchari]
MRISDVTATTVTLPLEAPLRHSNGVHWGRFVRTIVQVFTDEGLVGLGEMGGGESAEAAIRGLKQYLVGHDPFKLEELRFKIANPTASLYNNRTQMLAGVEFACLDLMGKYLNVSISQILGGRLRDRIPNSESCLGEVRTIDQLVQHATALRNEHGFRVHKLKGGVFHPDYELECYHALASTFPEDRLRYDPNAALSVEEAIRFGRSIERLNNDYFEDPTYGLNGNRRVRQNVRIPIATNTFVVNFEQLATNTLTPAFDVILLDTTFWGGIRACVKAASVCETFQSSIGVHSSGELGIQLATMLHLGAVLPNFTFAADSHYHHLSDDIIVGGKLTYRDGCIDVPTGPGLGVALDPDKLAEYSELYQKFGGYPYDRDPSRIDWFPLIPNDR